MKTASSIAATLIAATALLACGGQGTTGSTSKAPAAKEGEILATVGDDVITTAEFEARMGEQSPFIRARYDTLERKREFLDDMVRFELLAQEAERRGLANDPEVVAAMKKVMVQKLMRSEFDRTDNVEITEAELRAFYDEHIDDYVKPERVRVSHVFLAAAANAPDRAKVRTEANRLLAEVRAKEAGPIKTAFADAAKARSDDAASKVAGGDLLFKTKEELAQAWGAAFADAAFALKNIGDIGKLVETDQGFHLIKLTGRQNALNRPFESVKDQIRNRLFREKRTKAFEAFVEDLKKKANVTVREDVLAALNVVPEQRKPDLPHPAAVPAAGAEEKKAAPAKADAPATVEPAKAQPEKDAEFRGPHGQKLDVPANVLRQVKEIRIPQKEATKKAD